MNASILRLSLHVMRSVGYSISASRSKSGRHAGAVFNGINASRSAAKRMKLFTTRQRSKIAYYCRSYHHGRES